MCRMAFQRALDSGRWAPRRRSRTGSRTLYVRIPSADHPALPAGEAPAHDVPREREDRSFMEDTKKRLGAPCLIHPFVASWQFVAELEPRSSAEKRHRSDFPYFNKVLNKPRFIFKSGVCSPVTGITEPNPVLLRLRNIASIDKGTRGSAGRKCPHTASKPLRIHKVFSAVLFLVCEHFCSGRTASHRTALDFRGIFCSLDAGGLSPPRRKKNEKTGCPTCACPC